MSGKSKKSTQENIKIGIAALFTIVIIVLSVILTIDKTSYNAFVPIKYSVNVNYKGLSLNAFPSIEQTQQECLADGYSQCRELNPLWAYPTSKIDINYKECMWDVRNICAWANAKYPNYKR